VFGANCGARKRKTCPAHVGNRAGIPSRPVRDRTGGLSTARPWLCRLAEPRLSYLLAAEMRLFFQHMIYGTHVYYVRRRNLVLILTAKMSHPDIDGLLEGKLRQDSLL
jgi:hypothetical protein